MEPLLLSATLSNCGEALKLLYTKLCEKSLSGQGNDLGYGKSDKRWSHFIILTCKMSEMGYPQPSPKVFLKYKYYGCSSETRW